MTPHRMHSTPSGCSKPHFGQIMPEILPGHPGMPDSCIPFHEPAGTVSNPLSPKEDEIVERQEDTVKARQPLTPEQPLFSRISRTSTQPQASDLAVDLDDRSVRPRKLRDPDENFSCLLPVCEVGCPAALLGLAKP